MATAATTINSKQATIAFGVTTMTLHNWREGTKKRDKMPFGLDKAGRIQYSVPKLEKWAKKNAVDIVVPFDKVVTESKATQSKPGPKTAAAPAVKNKSAEKAKKAPLSRVPAAKKAAPAKKVTKKVAKQPEAATA